MRLPQSVRRLLGPSKPSTQNPHCGRQTCRSSGDPQPDHTNPPPTCQRNIVNNFHRQKQIELHWKWNVYANSIHWKCWQMVIKEKGVLKNGAHLHVQCLLTTWGPGHRWLQRFLWPSRLTGSRWRASSAVNQIQTGDVCRGKRAASLHSPGSQTSEWPLQIEKYLCSSRVS